MKKAIFKIILIISLLFIGFSGYAEENIKFTVNMGYLGIGAFFPWNNENNYIEGSLSILNLGMEHTKTNIGIEYSPFQGFACGYIDENIYTKSFVNLKLYWNILNDSFYFGPFTSANYMFYNSGFHWDSYVYTAGIHFGYRVYKGLFKSSDKGLFKSSNSGSVFGEIGYRSINGISKFYIGAKIDILSMIIFLIDSKIKSMEEL